MSSTTLVVFVIPVTLLVLNMSFFFAGLYIKRKEAQEDEEEANLAVESPKGKTQSYLLP